ncbi:hypothetical protein ISS42_02005 [Candidatus Shapirobacteria bacterium]|nr:hypothetical protein [Candidatus Shapirobacteria bacterium]
MRRYGGNLSPRTIRLVLSEVERAYNYPTRKEAMKREAQLKKWPKTKKEALIKGNLL